MKHFLFPGFPTQLKGVSQPLGVSVHDPASEIADAMGTAHSKIDTRMKHKFVNIMLVVGDPTSKSLFLLIPGL